MVAAVDDSVGRVLESLERLELVENTVVLFFSDNGGLTTLRNRPGPNCNLPLRSGKGWLYEGGVREPFIVRAPGVTSHGSPATGSSPRKPRSFRGRQNAHQPGHLSA